MQPVERPNVVRIDAADDPRLEDYREVRDRDVKGPEGRPGLFMVESALPVEKLLAIPGRAKSVLIAPAWLERLAPLAPEGVPVFVAPEEIMESIVGFRIHRGVMAVGYRPAPEELALERALPERRGPLTLLACEDVNNIDNVGLLFRNAAAFAVDAVVLSPRCHDPLYRKSVRVSIGHVLTMPWARADDWPADLDRLRRRRDLKIIGAATGPQARPLDEIERPERVAVLVGQEHRGLSRGALELCDAVARIPMAEGVDSLNVAVAAAVCLHRFSRGRRL